MTRPRLDRGLVLGLLALAFAAALYAPTVPRGLVDLDDPWLVRDNWIAKDGAVGAIAFDLTPATRAVLGAEYLPVRDISIVLDDAAWGERYAGFHASNVAIYLGAIALWIAALVAWGLPRELAGIAVLVWAVLPAHVESVAWISERKGLLAALLVGASALSFARFRAGHSVRWLVLAAATAACAVWSKAPAAAALAAFAVLELVLPARRASARRSMLGLLVIGGVSALAFVPVVVVAVRLGVVAAGAKAPAGPLAMALGACGFYLRLGALAVRDAIAYPIATDGPSALDLALGALSVAAGIAALATRRAPPALRAAAAIWLVALLPATRVVPMREVIVADRYILVPSLGLALAFAWGACAIPSARVRYGLVAAVVVAAGLRTLDAETGWHDSRTLWTRAVASNPRDGEAWSYLADELHAAGDDAGARAAVAGGLAHVRHPRLVLRAGLTALDDGDRERGRALLREAADGGEPLAMSDLALLLLSDGDPEGALVWARRGAEAGLVLGKPYGVLAQVALATVHPDEAVRAGTAAWRIDPRNLANRMNLALALVALGRADEARMHFEACLADPALAAKAREMLAR
jgi:hypothetical protein